jgi:hypothetical protein
LPWKFTQEVSLSDVHIISCLQSYVGLKNLTFQSGFNSPGFALPGFPKP